LKEKEEYVIKTEIELERETERLRDRETTKRVNIKRVLESIKCK
jgi:hypothetical protein